MRVGAVPRQHHTRDRQQRQQEEEEEGKQEKPKAASGGGHLGEGTPQVGQAPGPPNQTTNTEGREGRERERARSGGMGNTHSSLLVLRGLVYNRQTGEEGRMPFTGDGRDEQGSGCRHRTEC